MRGQLPFIDMGVKGFVTADKNGTPIPIPIESTLEICSASLVKYWIEKLNFNPVLELVNCYYASVDNKEKIYIARELLSYVAPKPKQMSPRSEGSAISHAEIIKNLIEPPNNSDVT